MNKRIEIVGILGAGKTTLLQKIDKLNKNIFCIYENLAPINKIWTSITSKKDRNYYHLLISAYYLESTRNLIYEIKENDNLIVTDYSLAVHHHVYAYYSWKKRLIDDIEWDSLLKMFTFYSNLLPPLAGVIEINTTPVKALENIKKRNRDFDKNTRIDYLEELSGHIQTHRENIIKGVPSVTVNSKEIMEFNENTQQKIITLFSQV